MAETFLVTIADNGESFSCPDDVAVLKAMVRLGRKGVPSGCHGGGCGVCKIKVVSGTIRTDPMSREHVSLTEEQSGVALACRAYPQSDICLKVLGKMQKAVTGKRYGFV